ncbi:PucR family transcriptional regulator [Bacillus carboniphilus]|uniref:PucR family transcriptional regulator n=1 Tax=Bacillus carboniphilus TaxID=86663 RepID=A0ABY9JPD7_9BACI|nr:PucR family transcriptional regulator [Bacillus carboniphilus]WLR41274.1 PucR family transcriptional regulator [Bacillus carboniphilus]
MNHDPFKYSFNNLDDIADRISEILQCAITIEDINHRLLAYSSHKSGTDDARTATIIERRVPEKVINRLWKDGIIPKLLQTDNPIRIKNIEEIGLNDRVAISIWHKQEVVGFIWALENEKNLEKDDIELLKKAAKSVKNKLLNLQARRIKKVEKSQEFFWKLLTGHVATTKEIKAGIEELLYTVPSSYSIVILKFPHPIDEGTEKHIHYLLETTQQVTILLSTIDYNELLMFIIPKTEYPLKDIKTFLHWLDLQLGDRYSIKGVMASIGGIYQDLTNIVGSYQEAQTVLKIKEKFPTETLDLVSYSELGIYQYLDILADQRKRYGFINYSLMKLLQYDEYHNTDLVKTLEAFLDEDGNAKSAANSLKVHLNTLSYRIKRIEQIGEIDLKNINQKMTIYLDLKIRKMTL